MKILLLEDDVILSEILFEHLSEQGHAVMSVYDGEEAYDEVMRERYDLMLFDVNVPTLSGFELLSLLREQQVNIPTIFITSLDSGLDIKKGFDIGCDDYLKKPFELMELDARIANIARLHSLDGQNIKIDNNSYLDRSKYELIKDGKTTKLSKKEFEVIEYFLSKRGRTVSHEELIANVWIESEVPTDATLRTYIKNIRALMGKEFINTIKGVGYRVDI